MNFSLHLGEHRLFGTKPASTEETALKQIVKRFFTFDFAPMTAWLVFDKKTGTGEALIVGRFKPKPHAQRTLGKMGIGVAGVDPKFQDILLHYGPEGLRWNGREVEANGN